MNVVFNIVILSVIGCVASEATSDPITSTLLPTTLPDTTTLNSTTSTPSPVTTTTVETPTITTTQLPSTTTSAPVTTVAPEPVAKEGSWNVTDGNVTCIRAELQIVFSVALGDVEETFALSPDASAAGSSCDVSNVTQVLVLSFRNYVLTFLFERDSDHTYVRNVTFVYSLPGATEKFYNDTKLFLVKNGNSYRCKSTDNVIMGNTTMHVEQIHLQAFGTADEDDFSTTEECAADEVLSDIIPIAVAVALAGMIIVVLIAYLVGRRRSRQKGYTSV